MNDAVTPRLIERLWYGGTRLTWPLLPISWLFGAAVRTRRMAYRLGWRSVRRLPVPVVVVGNITVGGTGKTPVVEWLVRQLQAAGLRPGIVSRGYGGYSRADPILVTAQSSADEVGDEPLLLARRTGVPVCVGADRVRAAERLVAGGASIIVADDGLQHYRLGRDLEIAVVDGVRGLGNGWLLPAGPLREPRGRLHETAFVLVNGGTGAIPGARFTLSGGAVVNLASGESRPLAEFSGRRVWAVAGIGHPQRFYADLRAFGIDPVPVPVADHGSVDLAALRHADDRPILMTEKDAVKYRRGDHPTAWYVPVQVSMPGDVAERITASVRSLLAAQAGSGASGVAVG